MSEIKILTQEDFLKANNKDVLEGYMYVKSLSEEIGKKGPFKKGTIQIKTDVPYKIWNNNVDYEKFNNLYKGQIIYAKVEVSEFLNIKQLTILPGFFVCEDKSITLDMFIPDIKYDIENNAKDYLTFLENHLSSKGFNIVKEVLELDKENSIFDEFKVCYAATINHDNYQGGLLSHSYKCLKILDVLVGIYPWLNTFNTEYLTNEDFKDLLYIGLGLHDIGKLKEINEDKYVLDSFNSHRVLGFEMIVKHKDLIVSSYNEHFYNLLVSIFIGHHDKYDDKAKTIYAYIIHKIDDLEAILTNIDQRIDFNILKDSRGQYIAFDDEHKLFI